MAAEKQGIDYFPNAVAYEDNVELVIAECGMKGLGILNRLWQKIYANGYFCPWNTDVALMFARKNGVGVNVVSEVLQSCFRRGVLNVSLYEKYEILTSKGIQKRYFEAVKRRKNIEVKKEYLLIDVRILSENVNIIAENVCKKSENVCNSEQIKVNKSKKDKSIEDSKPLSRFTPPTINEVALYCKERNNTVDAEKFVDYYTANGWMAGKVKMKDWKAAVRNWEHNEFPKGEKIGAISRKPTYDMEQIKKDAAMNTTIKY